VVCKSDRKALGRIDEVFGPVPRPLYTVRTSSAVELPCFARCRDARTHARVVCR
jgi:rRNA processing protein Gar1